MLGEDKTRKRSRSDLTPDIKLKDHFLEIILIVTRMLLRYYLLAELEKLLQPIIARAKRIFDLLKKAFVGRDSQLWKNLYISLVRLHLDI